MKITPALLYVCMFLGLVLTGCPDDMEPLPREKFLGSYNGNENCETGNNNNYSITVTESSSSDDAIILNNLLPWFNDGYSIRGTVAGSSLNFNDTRGGVTFSGSGNLSGETLTLIFTVSDGTGTLNCTLTCLKL